MSDWFSLRRLSSKQLSQAEKKNPELLGITNSLWEAKCRVKYPKSLQDMAEPDDPYHTWKDVYYHFKKDRDRRKAERKYRKEARKASETVQPTDNIEPQVLLAEALPAVTLQQQVTIEPNHPLLLENVASVSGALSPRRRVVAPARKLRPAKQ